MKTNNFNNQPILAAIVFIVILAVSACGNSTKQESSATERADTELVQKTDTQEVFDSASGQMQMKIISGTDTVVEKGVR